MRQTSVLLAVLAVGPLTAACTMSVGNVSVEDFRSSGYNVTVERRTTRDAMWLYDDTNDDHSLWAVSRDSRPLCVGFANSSGQKYRNWTLLPDQEVQIYRGRNSELNIVVGTLAPHASCDAWARR